MYLPRVCVCVCVLNTYCLATREWKAVLYRCTYASLHSVYFITTTKLVNVLGSKAVRRDIYTNYAGAEGGGGGGEF